MNEPDAEITWTGAYWRTFPPPEVGTATNHPPRPARVVLEDGRTRKGQRTQASVLALVPETWTPLAAVIAASDVSRTRTMIGLKRLVASGVIEMERRRPTCYWECWYRRVGRERF